MKIVTYLEPRIEPLGFLPARILDQIDVDPDGHLLWTASTTSGNYPRASRGGQLTMVARWVLEETAGPAPGPGWTSGHVCHDEQIGTCPENLSNYCWHRLCLEPTHLAWQELRTNILASSRTVASRNNAKTTCRLGHALLRVTVDAAGRDSRHCYECRVPSPWSVVSDEDREANLQYERELSASYAACL